MESQFTIVAVRHLDFTTKDGERILGDQIYLEGAADIGTGWCNNICCEKVWVDGVAPRVELKNGYNPCPGDPVICGFNRYGKVNSIRYNG